MYTYTQTNDFTYFNHLVDNLVAGQHLMENVLERKLFKSVSEVCSLLS